MSGMPPGSAELAESINIDQILGVILICLIIAAYLFGMSSSQAYIYYDRFPKDKWTTKALVGLLWALDSFHTALMSHTVYFYTVTNFGNFAALAEKPVFSFNLEIVVVPVLAFIVQVFFALRAYGIDRSNWPLAFAIGSFALAQLVFGIIACVIAFTKFDGFLHLKEHSWALIAWLATGACADILVTVSLVHTFWKNKTSFSEEDGWMTKILMYGVHTGLFTTITTIIDLFFIAFWPQTLAFCGLNYILGKLYTNTMLYALNRRPVTDPRYASSHSGQSRSKPHNLSSLMPQFANGPGGQVRSGGSAGVNGVGSGNGAAYGVGANVHVGNAPNPYSLTAPRIQPKDPYAMPDDLDDDNYYGNDKRPSLTGDDQAFEVKADGHSDSSYAYEDGKHPRQADIESPHAY